MGFVVEVPADLRHAAPHGPRARKAGAAPHSMYARLGGCCDALRDAPAFLARYAPLRERVEFCPDDTTGCATALAVLWLAHGGMRVAGAIGGSAVHGPAVGPALEEVALCLAAQGRDTGLTRLDLLPEAAKLLRRAGLPLSRHKPVLGADIFTVESGIHVDGIARPAFVRTLQARAVGVRPPRSHGPPMFEPEGPCASRPANWALPCRAAAARSPGKSGSGPTPSGQPERRPVCSFITRAHLPCCQAPDAVELSSGGGLCLKIILVDATLRDGEQAPGFAFAPQQGRLARLLDAAGVGQIGSRRSGHGRHQNGM